MQTWQSATLHSHDTTLVYLGLRLINTNLMHVQTICTLYDRVSQSLVMHTTAVNAQ